MTAPTLNREHIGPRLPGTYAAYKIDGCRCYPCSAAQSAYWDTQQRAIAAGTWRPFVDAREVREHLAVLSANGIGWRHAARLAGLSTSTVSKLLHGTRDRAPSTKVRTSTAEALLALRPSIGVAADHAVVDGTGFRRRLQALIARGFTRTYLAARLGMTPANLRLTSPRVLAKTHRAACDLYDELWNRDPVASGIAAHRARRAREYAAARGWPPPAAWDDEAIDDPRARPLGVRKEDPCPA